MLRIKGLPIRAGRAAAGIKVDAQTQIVNARFYSPPYLS